MNLKYCEFIKQSNNQKYVHIDMNLINYYHNLIDTLPLILEIRNYYPNIIFIIENKTLNTLSKIIFDLKIINLKLESINNFNSINKFISINPIKVSNIFNNICLTNNLNEIRKDLIVKKDLPKKIIIKRHCEGRKKQRNICKNIFNYIKSTGFTEIICANYSVLEQANLFYNADIIISSHGADLANIIFCKSGSQVIELNNGYNFILFGSYIWNSLYKNKIIIDKRIIFNQKIMEKYIIHKEESFMPYQNGMWKIGNNSYIKVDSQLIHENEINDEFIYELEAFKKIFF